MKKLGLVGGMGPESTIAYYHDIVYAVQERTGGDRFPPLTVESVDVFEILRLCGERKLDELTDYLDKAIHRLALAGADFAALSANTPHIVFDRLAALSPIPLISIVETVCAEAERRKFRKIGLLGTIFTMTETFFKKPFLEKGIRLVLPSEREMEFVNRKIASELERGVVRQETLTAFQEILSRMRAEEQIEAVLLGCTELPLLLSDKVSPVPCLDTARIHVHAIVDAILE